MGNPGQKMLQKNDYYDINLFFWSIFSVLLYYVNYTWLSACSTFGCANPQAGLHCVKCL